MSDIDKKLVYNAYGDANIWLIDVEDKFSWNPLEELRGIK